MKTLLHYLNLLAAEAAKNVAKVPGWVLLAATCFAFSYYLLPDRLTVFGYDIATPKEVIALLATAVLYAIGDIVDTTFFAACTRGRFPSHPRARDSVRKCLCMQQGVYRVSLAIASAAGRYEGTRIQMKNEVAKFARSLIVPALSVFTALALKTDLPSMFAVVFVVVVLVITYLRLKIGHIVDIYNLIALELIKDPRYSFYDPPNDVRMFFWDGQFVASGLKK